MQGIHMVSELLRNFLFFVQKLSSNTVQRYLNLLFYNQGTIISSFPIVCTDVSSCFGQVLHELKCVWVQHGCFSVIMRHTDDLFLLFCNVLYITDDGFC